MAKRFYPSTKKVQKNDIEWLKMAEYTKNNGKNLINLDSPVQFNDEGVAKTHEAWRNKFADEWVNPIANVGVGNSIMQYSEWANNRLSYAECAFLANDSIINNALSKVANEMLRKGGEIVISAENKDFESELKTKLETRLKELNFWQIIHKAIVTSLTYGGALIFTDCNAENLETPLYTNKAIFSQNPIRALKVIEPYLCGANSVNATNPLNADFMIPNMWFVSGGGQVHKSRVETLIMFESPDMIKPLYNYLGISLCQFMRDYVMSADISRKGLADIFQRFRTIIIKSPLIKNNIDQAVKRIEAINRQRNNNSAIALTEDEEYIETITSITGLDKLIAQMQENIAISARIPAVKLLGLTPSGFNATGDFDMRSYYDEIMSLQNAILKPIVEKYLHFISLEFGYDIKPEFVFNRLDSDNALNETQIKNTEAQMVLNLIQGGVITQEQGFDYLKSKDILDNNLIFDDSADDDDLGDLDNDLDTQFADAGWSEYNGMSNNAVSAINNAIQPISYFNTKDCRILEDTLGLPYRTIKQHQLRDFVKKYGNTGEYHHISTSKGKYDKVYFYDLPHALLYADLNDINNAFNLNLKEYDGDSVIDKFENLYKQNYKKNGERSANVKQEEQSNETKQKKEAIKAKIKKYETDFKNITTAIHSHTKESLKADSIARQSEIDELAKEFPKEAKQLQEAKDNFYNKLDKMPLYDAGGGYVSFDKETAEYGREYRNLRAKIENNETLHKVYVMHDNLKKALENPNLNENDLKELQKQISEVESTKKEMNDFLRANPQWDFNQLLNVGKNNTNVKKTFYRVDDYVNELNQKAKDLGLKTNLQNNNGRWNQQEYDFNQRLKNINPNDDKQGSGEWKEKDHPRNPDGSFKSK